MKTHQLPNGLRLYFEPMPDCSSVALGFLVLSGSRDEPPDRSGITHFLEHLCFKASRRRSCEQLSLEVDSLGAQWNAYTWWEGSCHHLWVPAGNVAPAVRFLVETLRPAFRREEFEVEKQVILEEIAMSMDAPEETIFEELLETVYGRHPITQRILGTSESIERLRGTDLSAFHRDLYRPNRMAFAAVGNFCPEELAGLVRSECGRWRPGLTHEVQGPPRFRRKRRASEREELERAHLILAVPAPPRRSSDSTMAGIVACILGDVDNSRLYWAVRQEGLADEISAEYEGFSDGGLLCVYASVDPGNVERVALLIEAELDAMHSGLDSAQFARARQKALTDAVCGRENCQERFDEVVTQISTGARLCTLEEEVAELDKLTVDDLSRYLRKYPLNRGAGGVILNGG